MAKPPGLRLVRAHSSTDPSFTLPLSLINDAYLSLNGICIYMAVSRYSNVHARRCRRGRYVRRSLHPSQSSTARAITGPIPHKVPAHWHLVARAVAPPPRSRRVRSPPCTSSSAPADTRATLARTPPLLHRTCMYLELDIYTSRRDRQYTCVKFCSVTYKS